MGMSAEKLVKHTIKLISKTNQLDYDELKESTRKVLKLARKFDDQLLGMMEDLMDIGNIGSEEELEDYDPEVLKMYCRIKELDETLSEKKMRQMIWNNIQEEYEIDDSDDDVSLVESESDTDSQPDIKEVVIKKEPITDTETVLKKVKKIKI
jgi:hypothetical protein